jgi:hypothetical protein
MLPMMTIAPTFRTPAVKISTPPSTHLASGCSFHSDTTDAVSAVNANIPSPDR